MSKGYWSMMMAGLFLGLILVSVFWFWQTLRDPQTLPFHEVRINGRFQYIQAQDLQHVIQPQIRGNFFSIQLKPIKQSLMLNPWVEDVAIRRVPGTLIINVSEHQPVARWNDDSLVDHHDHFFSAPGGSPPNLPLLSGPEGSQALILEKYKQINLLLKEINLKIKEIKLDKRQSWQMILDNNISVTIGRDEILPRVQRLIRWYPQIINGRVGSVAHIDLRYATSIAVQFKNFKKE